MILQTITLLVPTLLLALVLVPSRYSNLNAQLARKAITTLLGFQTVIATLGFLWLLTQQPTVNQVTGSSLTQRFSVSLSHYDGVSSLMFLLVSFVGLIVCKFSIRYLDGDQNQGVFFQWLGFTLSAVSLLVVAGNLILFFMAWVMTSFGLHHLLMHFKERPWARRAAWTKFAISRIGDVFLLAAMILVYREFGSYRLADILALAKEITEPSWQLSLVGWFLILGAVTKSAQFPVHFWLPETMEAPTPVSALMHAGIVNAGGYLLIRWSPLVVHAPGAMAFLVIVGGLTALFASLVMMTQANIKRSLGYSTVAQMGFMMLQCGFGAFSAAMLHIIAHSLYKAHAFLRTGDAWRVERPTDSTVSVASQSSFTQTGVIWNQMVLAFAVLTVGGAIALISNAFKLELTLKAGGIALVSILCLALASWLVQAHQVSWRALGKTSLAGLLMIVLYLISYQIVDNLTYAYLPVIQSNSILGWLGISLIGLFACLAILHTLLPETYRRRWMQILYVNISNGFYVDTIVRRSLGLSLTGTPSAS